MSEILNITRPDGRKVAIVVISCDEIDALRAKLAESEAASAALATKIANAGREDLHAPDCWLYVGTSGQPEGVEPPTGYEGCHGCTCGTLAMLANLPASVRAHMEEDAALREVARIAASSGLGREMALREALTTLKRVRAKSGDK